MGFFDIGEREQRSFLSVVRHTVLEGPLTLVRFSDSIYGEQGALGKYWLYGSEVEEALAAQRGSRLVRAFRERLAVSDDWGDMQLTWALHLPPGHSMNAYWGFAKFQPRLSVAEQARTRARTTESYAGGSIQLVLNLDVADRKMIKGPFRTLGLSRSDLAAT